MCNSEKVEKYSDVEIKYMLEELSEKTKYQPVFTKEQTRRILEHHTKI
ncbi:hypothetical protein [Staphylococcus gallinarum]